MVLKVRLFKIKYLDILILNMYYKFKIVDKGFIYVFIMTLENI